MPPAGAERWFHTLVVVGAALGGCGGRTSEQGHSTPSSDGGSVSAAGSTSMTGGTASSTGGGGPTSPDACNFDAEFVCQDYPTRSNCRCDVSRPHDARACQSPFDFTCTELPCSAPTSQICLGERWVDCRCDPSALKPADCGAPEHFFCSQAFPPFRDCACRPETPLDPAVCPGSYCCQSNDPRFGCDCSCARIG